MYFDTSLLIHSTSVISAFLQHTTSCRSKASSDTLLYLHCLKASLFCSSSVIVQQSDYADPVPHTCWHSSFASILCSVCDPCRLKASLERLQRATETYSELLLDLLPPVAQALGNALGVEPYIIQTFTEAEIRANVVFQVRLSYF